MAVAQCVDSALAWILYQALVNGKIVERCGSGLKSSNALRASVSALSDGFLLQKTQVSAAAGGGVYAASLNPPFFLLLLLFVEILLLLLLLLRVVLKIGRALHQKPGVTESFRDRPRSLPYARQHVQVNPHTQPGHLCMLTQVSGHATPPARLPESR